MAELSSMQLMSYCLLAGVFLAVDCERIVNVWNSLPDEIDFSTVKSFTRTIKRVSFNSFVSYS